MLASDVIQQVKLLANISKSQRYPDSVLLIMLSRAQRSLQRVVYNAYPNGNLFAEEVILNTSVTPGQIELPVDMVTPNSIIAISPYANGRRLTPLRALQAHDVDDSYGYKNLGKWVLVNGTYYTQFSVIYSKIWPRVTALGDTLSAPDSCEDFLIRWMEREIKASDASSDREFSVQFTRAERTDIEELFAENSRDIIYPTIVNTNVRDW